jgi:hypothetical protein
MSRKSWFVLLAVLCAVDAHATTAPPPAATPGAIAFEHASVVPMDSERVLPDHTVVVVDGTITAVGPSESVEVPAGARRIDASGHFLLPALCDMHVHIEGESWNALLGPEAQAASKDTPFEDFLFPFVANGVTTVEVLSGTHELLELRGRTATDGLAIPRMSLARMIDGPDKAWPPPLSVWVADAGAARAATRQAKAEGYDKMKVYSFLDKPSYDAVIVTSREQQMDVIGHIPYALTPEYVVAAGQKLIAHTEEVAKHANGDYSLRRIHYYADLIADGDVYLTPTLVTTRSILESFTDPDGLFSRPESAYAKHPIQSDIWKFIAAMNRRITPGAQEKLRIEFEQFQKPLTRVFHDHGGQLMTGTDSLLPRLVPGFALHRELRELVDVGLTPYQALRASTTVPFEYLGEGDVAGTVAAGKRTDLILVHGNPLEDIAAAGRIDGVLLRGRWLGRDEIDERMRRIREKHAAH